MSIQCRESGLELEEAKLGASRVEGGGGGRKNLEDHVVGTHLGTHGACFRLKPRSKGGCKRSCWWARTYTTCIHAYAKSIFPGVRTVQKQFRKEASRSSSAACCLSAGAGGQPGKPHAGQKEGERIIAQYK